MHARGRARIQKGDDSWCAMSSFCIGGEFVYTELWGRSSANEPVLYMIRHNGASVCVRCLGHDFYEWELPSSPMMMMMMMMSMIVMMRMLMRVRMRSVFFLHSSNSRHIQLLQSRPWVLGQSPCVAARAASGLSGSFEPLFFHPEA